MYWSIGWLTPLSLEGFCLKLLHLHGLLDFISLPRRASDLPWELLAQLGTEYLPKTQYEKRQGSLPRGNPTIAPLRASASRGSWPVCGTMDINAQDYSHSFKQLISFPVLICKAICHPLGTQNKTMASAFKKQVVLICGI